jgi:transcriptional regulator with XRE-family HTH domain
MSDEPAPTSLQELLTRLRLETGISMYELAKRTGINRSTLMRIEDGTTTSPDIGTLNTLARYFGVEPELFYDAVWHGTDQPLPSPAVYFRSKYQLSPEQITELERSIQRIADKPDQPTNDTRTSRTERRSS